MSQPSYDVSKGVVIFTGYGVESHPGEYIDRVINVFGKQESERVLKEIEQILEDMNQLNPDWSLLSLSDAGIWAKGKIRDRYPYLSVEALNALEWTFTWWWK